MKITAQSTNDGFHIGVLGRLEQAADRDALTQYLSQINSGQKVQVDFYDAATLPREIIAALSECLTRAITLKIITYHTLLTHTLLRLDLPAHPVAIRTTKPPSQPQALVLAGSANSLDKILSIVTHLPLANIAVFVVQHVSESQTNLLDKLLQTRTSYQVVMPSQEMQIRQQTIYVAPPGHHMKVADGKVYLTRDQAVQFARPSIDVLFEALAQEYQNNLLAVLLCGFGQDGVRGCAQLTQMGACVVVEDPDECGDACALPKAALAEGNFDHVLRLPALCSLVAAYAEDLKYDNEITDHHLTLLIDALFDQYGYDFRGYQRGSLKRRLAAMLAGSDFHSLFQFQRAIFSDTAAFNRMIAQISVGVSSFFRHPEQFNTLRKDILPYLDSFPVIKVWSAGCAGGEEPYSLATLLDEMGLLTRCRLFATDLNAYLIDMAKTGLFPAKTWEASLSNYMASGGVAKLDQYLEKKFRYLAVTDKIRNATLFHRHSLVDEGIFNEFQLIVCRNVMIYFDQELQSKVLARFAKSLHPDGFLMLGPHDGLHRLAQAAGFVPHESSAISDNFEFTRGNHIYRLNNGERNG